MKKMKQNENVSKTVGESNIFEGRIPANSEIVKIRLKYVFSLTTQNRHARQTTGNAMQAQRTKIQEIKLK